MESVYTGVMHHDVMRQIRTGVAMHEAYLVWRYDRTSINYDNYIRLLEELKEYEPDPNAKF
jgi:hypothetical protein